MMKLSLIVLCVNRKSFVTYKETAAPTEAHCFGASHRLDASIIRMGRPLLVAS